MRAAPAVVLVAGYLVATAGCEFRVQGDWTEAGVTAIYEKSLEELREAVGSDGELVVHPQPRFLFEDERGGLRMGDFNRFGDPDFNRALARDSLVVPCSLDVERGCSLAEHPEYVMVSEPVPVHRREAALMVVHVDRTRQPGSSRSLILHLRFGSGEWRVSRLTAEGDGAVPLGAPRRNSGGEEASRWRRTGSSSDLK